MLFCVYAIVNILEVDSRNPIEEAFSLFPFESVNKFLPKYIVRWV